MSTRAQILEETLARLEAERFAGPRRPDLRPPQRPKPAPITPDEALGNARVLLEALGDVEEVVQIRAGRSA